MCEFCTKHGEGKKWYLVMKNYGEELLHQELSSEMQAIVQAKTRYEWNNRFWQCFVMPAVTGVPEPELRWSHAQNLEESKVEHFGQALPIEDVEQVVDRVDSITRLPCGCRFASTGKTDLRYCFGLGIDKWGVLGRYPAASASLEVLTKDEALKIIRQLDVEGLFHTVWTGVTPYTMGICNCDRDCGAYAGWVERREPDFFRSEYVGRTDWDLCSGCKSCMSQCQFGAIFYSSALAKVHIDPTRCFGCGVCRAACPNDAVTLLPRVEVPEAANLW